MKVTRIVVEVKQGLPNYSFQTATAEVVADEGESLSAAYHIAELKAEIQRGLSLKVEHVKPTLPDTKTIPVAEKPDPKPDAKPEAPKADDEDFDMSQYKKAEKAVAAKKAKEPKEPIVEKPKKSKDIEINESDLDLS